MYLGTTRKQIVIGRGYIVATTGGVYCYYQNASYKKKKKYALIRK